MMPFCHTSTRALLWTLALPTALALGGCPNHAQPPAEMPAAQQKLARSQGVREPKISREAVTAGMPVTVDCSADGPDDNAVQAGRPALFPEAPMVAADGDQATFVPTRAGSYVTQCISDRDGAYAAGPALLVLPAAPRALTVQVHAS